MKCLVCNSNSTALWSDRSWTLPGFPSNFRYRICLKCESIYCDPLPTSYELAEYYSNHFDYGWFEKHITLKKIQAAGRWKSIATRLKNYRMNQGRVIDIGCGHGMFLSCAKNYGWEVVGIDYPSIATIYAREQMGLEVMEGDLCSLIADNKITQGRFNLVSSWHCLEHVRDPLSFLRGMSANLASNGKLLVAVPNVNSKGMKLCRENWIWCQQPYVHITHFSEKALNLLAENSGLKVLDIWTRDTWDANPEYDIHVAPLIRLVNRLLRPLSETATFWLEEGGRVACFVANQIGYQLFRSKNDYHGSELLLLAERDKE